VGDVGEADVWGDAVDYGAADGDGIVGGAEIGHEDDGGASGGGGLIRRWRIFRCWLLRAREAGKQDWDYNEKNSTSPQVIISPNTDLPLSRPARIGCRKRPSIPEGQRERLSRAGKIFWIAAEGGGLGVWGAAVLRPYKDACLSRARAGGETDPVLSQRVMIGW
jgi:hypothetical protein